MIQMPIQYASPLYEASCTGKGYHTNHTNPIWKKVSYRFQIIQQQLAIGEEEVLDLNPFLVHFPCYWLTVLGRLLFAEV